MGKFRHLYIPLAILLFLGYSCNEEPILTEDPLNIEDLSVPDGFNFEMVKSIEISVQLPSTVSYSANNRIVEFWSEGINGQPDKLIKTGIADNNGRYQESFSISAAGEKIFTNCFAGWRSLNLRGTGLKQTNGVFAIDYNIGYGKAPPDYDPDFSDEPGNGVKKMSNSALKAGIENVIGNGDFSSNKFGKIDTWSTSIQTDGLWYATDDAKNYASIVNEEGNSFVRINREDYSAGGFTQLVPAISGQIVTFSGDTRGFDSQQDVYLFLIPRNQNGEFLNAFSYKLVNPGIAWVNGTVAGVMPEGTTACQILFFKSSTGIVDFDNAVVHVNDMDSDRDVDGVLDWEDNYPDDAEKALDDAYPGKGKPGTFAFDDLWPLKGDYDFNDIVVDYQMVRVYNTKNQVIEIDLITQTRAIGDAIQNGFGLQIYISPELISGIKSEYNIQENIVTLNPNGTETGQKWATFILFTDAFKELTHSGENSPTINTTMGYHFIVPDEKRFRIYLKEPVDPDLVSPEKINPFIFRTADRTHEIHLKGFPPTDLANHELFGTGNDATNLSVGVYYQTSSGLPWAINVPVMFEYTVEGVDILKGYPYFADWTASSGKGYKDWYLDIQGYRNWENIYRW